MREHDRDIRIADDLIIFAKTEGQMQINLNIWEKALNEMNFQINTEKKLK